MPSMKLSYHILFCGVMVGCSPTSNASQCESDGDDDDDIVACVMAGGPLISMNFGYIILMNR